MTGSGMGLTPESGVLVGSAGGSLKDLVATQFSAFPEKKLKGISIYSWIGTLSPGFPIAALLSTRNRTTITST